MNDLQMGELNKLSSFHFQPAETFQSEHRRAYWRRIMDLEPMKHSFLYINALCTDGKNHLLIGTEEGDVLIFSLRENRILRMLKADRWLNSLLLSNLHVFTVGKTRAIKCFQLRNGKMNYVFPQSEDGYGAKGVKLCETGIRNKLIANVGYGRFKIFDSIKFKAIYSFDIAHDSVREVESEYGTANPTVLNYCVIKSFFKVCYLLEEDGHIYFYNFKEHKLIKKVKLFDYGENLALGMLLVNSLLLEHDGFLFIVLQFSKTVDDWAHDLKTVLCVVRIYKKDDIKRIDTMFHSRLYGLEFVNSKSVTRSYSKLDDNSNRFHMVLGSSTGISTNYIIDIEKKSVILHDRIVKSDTSDMISATIFYHNGTIASTSEGKIIHMLNVLTTGLPHSPDRQTKR